MLDINLFRQKQTLDIIALSQSRRYKPVNIVYEIAALDKDCQNRKRELRKLRKKWKKLGKEVASMLEEDCSNLRQEAEELGVLIATKDADLQETKSALDEKLQSVGNLVHKSVCVSNDEADNETVYRWGKIRVEEGLRSHVDLVRLLGIAVVHNASRDYTLKDDGVYLNQALLNLGTKFLIEKGYMALMPPITLSKGHMQKCAQHSKLDKLLYTVTEDGEERYLIATSEQPLCTLHMDEWFDSTELPIKYAGNSKCFRKEAGKHGRDTGGLYRVHQFDKIEQFVITSPDEDDSWIAFENMISVVQEFYQLLEIPYRVVSTVSGKLSSAASKKYDLEGWFPGSGSDSSGPGRYRELVSCSNCTDYQSRKLGIRFGKKEDKTQKYCHLLNSTLVATQRTMCCLLETHQTDTGVVIPEALRPFMGGTAFLPFVEEEKEPRLKKVKKARPKEE